MRIDLVFPVLPPMLNGIGDHTALLATELGARHRVRILTSQAACAPVPDATVETVEIPGVSTARGGTASGAAVPLLEAVAVDPPDWLVVQYNPFSYGRRGLNGRLPRALLRLRAARTPTRIAVMVHEPFVPVDGWKNAMMTTWQRAQFALLGHAADLMLFSIEPWARRFSGWFPSTPVRHLPVGSNIPRAADGSAERTRRRLGLGQDELVVGLFGSAHPSRLLSFARAAVEALAHAGHAPRVLYVGPHGDKVREAIGAPPIVDAGPLAAAAVSHHFGVMDLYLAPFQKGVSTRRGSFMTGLQHGVATVSTYGKHTDPTLLRHNGSAFLLAPDHDPGPFRGYVMELARAPRLRQRIGQAGREHFEHTYAWPRLAAGLEEAMARCTAGETTRPAAAPPLLISNHA